MEKKYDSTADTLQHIKRVNALLLACVANLLERASVHDASKLVYPEKEGFDEWTPKLAGSTYGSEEYKTFLSALQDTLFHHYAVNSHHPEHYSNGMDGMDLFDVMEMLMDWKAATERHKNGDILKSLEINTKRFNISPQLVSILHNTIINMGLEPKKLTTPHEFKK